MNIKLLDKSISYDRVGVVAITFRTETPTWRFLVFYMAKGNLHIFSNKMLCDVGIIPSHGPGTPSLNLTDGSEIPMNQKRGISVVGILPPRARIMLEWNYKMKVPTFGIEE